MFNSNSSRPLNHKHKGYIIFNSREVFEDPQFLDELMESRDEEKDKLLKKEDENKKD